MFQTCSEYLHAVARKSWITRAFGLVIRYSKFLKCLTCLERCWKSCSKFYTPVALNVQTYVLHGRSPKYWQPRDSETVGNFQYRITFDSFRVVLSRIEVQNLDAILTNNEFIKVWSFSMCEHPPDLYLRICVCNLQKRQREKKKNRKYPFREEK